MCSPNALIYQQMVIAPNAYWLNFFLKRDINVICWNYRGYGESQIGYLDFLSPSKAKRDAERVLAGSIEALGLKGKIGIYGRSIGGITATHLAAQYNDLVEVLIIDRSLNEL
jgi:pimeloyl-ACP methyl ester carboxylesterase